MDLKQLEYFVRVAELGSFTRAAAALGVAQPALSRQVRQLEVELRQNLLLRNGRGVTPTDAGLRVLAHGRGILHQVQRLRHELDRARGALVGRVALGLPPTLSKVLAVPLIRGLRQCMPDVALSITEALSVTMQESIAAGRLDIALVYNPVASPEIEIHVLAEEALYLIERGGPDAALAPISLRELAQRPLVIPSRPNALRMQVESALARQRLTPCIALEIDSVNAILELVGDGAGSAVLARSTVATLAADAGVIARPISTPALTVRLARVQSARRPATPALRAAGEFLDARIAELLAQELAQR